MKQSIDQHSSPVLNPHLRLFRRRDKDRIVAITFWAPRRGQPLNIFEASASTNARVFSIFTDALGREREVSAVDPDDVEELVRHGVFVYDDDISRMPTLDVRDSEYQNWDLERKSEAATQLRSMSYATVPAWIPERLLHALRVYYGELIHEGFMALGDAQSIRYWAHNDPIGRQLQRCLRPLVENVVGSEVQPTYSYAVQYHRGAELPPHVDRAQCEYTVSLLVDFDGPEAATSPWPLRLHFDEERIVSLHQRRGDAAIYLGPRLRHSRPPLDAAYSTSVLLHYIDAPFARSMD